MPATDAHSISSDPLGNGHTSWAGQPGWDGVAHTAVCSLISVLLSVLGKWLDCIPQALLQSHVALSLSCTLVP